VVPVVDPKGKRKAKEKKKAPGTYGDSISKTLSDA